MNLSAYYIGETEVTQDLWQAVMGGNPSCFDDTGIKAEMGNLDTAPAPCEIQKNRPVEMIKLQMDGYR